MAIDFSIFDKALAIDAVQLALNDGEQTSIDILRLDQIHGTISGNKWFKLKYNLLEAENKKAASILSFGGAYSNHLHALAYAGRIFNIKTIGIVRGEEVSNPTLQDCKNWGMELHFVSRTDYRKKTEASFLQNLQNSYPGTYIIPEGGDNELGQKGSREILQPVDTSTYDVLCCSIGTGTTISGLAAFFENEVWGFAPFKNAHSLNEKLSQSIPQMRYIDDYHFGGFGKSTPELLAYASNFYKQHQIELDKVYTAKMFFGLSAILKDSLRNRNRKILVVHTGGVQGNRLSNS